MEKLHKIILLIILTLSFVTIHAQQEKADSAKKQEESIYNYIDNFINSISQNNESLIAAVNYSIAFAKDTTVKSQIAGYLFNRFSTSGIMGQESIAIYISKNYFLNGQLPWYGQGGVALLQLYTEFNEHSLIGMQAPELNLNRANGQYLSLSSLKERYTIVYFFDNECKACNEGLPGLKEIIKTYNHLSLDVYAVYTQSDSNRLNEFINKNFEAQERSNWHFVYDPLMESNFHKLYNVLVTPRLFLLGRDKKIIGRNLSNSSLKELLEQEQNSISQTYKLAENFIGQYLSIFNLKDSAEQMEAFEPLFNRLSKENLDMYNAVFYQLFEYLSAQEEQYLKTAAVFLAKNYILPYKELWFNNLFVSNRVPAIITKITNNSVGAKLPSPTLFTSTGSKRSWSKIKPNYIYLYFFNTDCAVCKPFSYELKKIFGRLKKQKVKVIAVYTGTDNKELITYIKEERPPWNVLYTGSDPQVPLHELFETEYTPQTYLIDTNGIIIAKGINTIQLLKLLK